MTKNFVSEFLYHTVYEEKQKTIAKIWSLIHLKQPDGGPQKSLLYHCTLQIHSTEKQTTPLAPYSLTNNIKYAIQNNIHIHTI